MSVIWPTIYFLKYNMYGRKNSIGHGSLLFRHYLWDLYLDLCCLYVDICHLCFEGYKSDFANLLMTPLFKNVDLQFVKSWVTLK